MPNRPISDDRAAEAKRRYPPAEFYRAELPGMPTPRRADDWVDGGLCPFHDDRHAGNFRVHLGSGAYTCFACEAKGGDVLDFVQARYSLSFPQALDKLLGPAAPTNGAARPPAGKPAKPKRAKALTFDELGPPVATYDYVDGDGVLVFQVLRYEPAGHPKEFKQRRPDPAHPGRWIWKLDTLPTPTGKRPLYNLPAVLAAVARGKSVFLVEGEKCVQALTDIGLTATTLSGGARTKWSEHDLAPLAGATVVVIPDNDALDKRGERPGLVYAQRALLHLPGAVLLPLPGLPEDGSDVVDWLDAGGTRDDLVRLARQALAERDNRPQQAAPPPREDRPFVALGYNQGRYYFLSNRQGQVHSLSAGQLRVKPAFLELAPLNWWEAHWAGSQGVDWTGAADQLIQDCLAAGLYDPARRRGRGAWWDVSPEGEPRTVLHQGDSLVVDGEPVGLLDFRTRYVYERAPRMRFAGSAPLGPEDGLRLADLCKALPFEHPAAGQLLAGWIVLAPICGILRWRPHIWVTGSAGSGKSWVLDNIVGAMLGDVALRVQSVTTEAGLRQALGQDARPVLFDEAELEDQKSQLNIQRVLELARQASSESGAVILKGSATGETVAYNIRSTFCLSSIAVGVKRRADETRVTVLGLRRPRTETDEERLEAAQAFEDVQRLTAQVATPDYAGALVARACKLARVIRANAETFAVAVSQALGSRRTGDQLGALLAGYWCLWSDAEVTLAEAADYARGLGLQDLAPDEETRDEHRCLAHLLEQTVTVDTSAGRAVQRTLGELVDAAGGRDSDVEPKRADLALKRYGIQVREDGLAVSNTHSALARLLSGTPWGTGWATFLRRLNGATCSPKPVTFPGHAVSRVTIIPWATIEGTDPAAEGPAAEGRGRAGATERGVSGTEPAPLDREEHDEIPF